MEPKGSLPHSQMPAACPYPEPDSTRLGINLTFIYVLSFKPIFSLLYVKPGSAETTLKHSK